MADRNAIATAAVLVGLLALLLAAPLGAAEAPETAPDKPAVKTNGPETYKDILLKNPFSPKMYIKPTPPPKKKDPLPTPPREKKIIKVDNLVLAGIVLEGRTGKYTAMIVADGSKDIRLGAGKTYNKIKVLSVTLDGIKILDHEGKSRTVEPGQAFHDGKATRTEWTGGPPPSAPPTASKTKPSTAKSTMDDARRKALIEKMKARRAKKKK